MVAVLERHMAGREFMAGDRLSVADFTAAHTLDWANEAEMLDDAPRLREYLAKMYARPTAPQTIAEAFAASALPTPRLGLWSPPRPLSCPSPALAWFHRPPPVHI